MAEQMISIEEIATVQGRKPAQVREEARGLGMWIGEDWAGREAVTVTDARALVSGDARRRAEQGAAWKAFQGEVKAWQDGRAAATQAAADEAEQKIRRTRRRVDISLGEVQEARRLAHLHAGAQWERRHPRPRWNAEPTVPLAYLTDESEEGSAMAAVKGKLRGPSKPAERTEVA
ncbi:hypothetical protein SAMN05443665_11066 [Actinomadura meyerae]|uniref:Uncharacterized protein n=1 Tax=Actinomadura meyerae TaxID=240840 RepID=A0A239P8P6_9ACTN|nr:hypothetical protein [Actinomadura meyerae]SNT63421.1 hypothetical protein SAMN05443665_11066 [Actinomadura meyerae]